MSTDQNEARQNGPLLTGIGWVVTALVSSLPDIVWVQLNGNVPGWLTVAKIVIILSLALAASIWKSLRPLRPFFLILLAFFFLAELRPRVDFTWPALQHLFGGTAFDVRMQAEQTGKLAVSLAMVLVLLLLGYKRRDFFLARGDLRAPIGPVPLLGFARSVPWSWFGMQWSIYIAATLAVVQYLGLRPDIDLMVKVLPMVPSVLFYAALNAFNEEMTYRAPILATLEPAAGTKPALWMSASFFGIAHYFGTPGGILGAIASIFMGWILGKGMLETRGLFWSWWIHFLSDIAIFFFLAMILLRG